MKKSLYLVDARAVFQLVVCAESPEEAHELAREHAETEFENWGEGFVCTVLGKRIPKPLHETYPYGTNGAETVGEMLSDGAECQDQQWEVN
jgi:hypothetical protein